jgi:hypothetical protein
MTTFTRILSRNSSTIIPKLINLIVFLLSDDTRGIRIVLRQLRSKRVKTARKLLELGMNQRGGAPRVFIIRDSVLTLFVAAGIEKSQSGCRELGIAVQRESAILAEPMPSSRRLLQRRLGERYVILESNEDLLKLQTGEMI